MTFLGPQGSGSGEMAGFVTGKMKRKDLEEVYDEFSEFSLSSPAKKIRRLDADLPPIMEEEEAPIPQGFGQWFPAEEQVGSGAAMAVAAPSFPLNEERAIVLYKPVNSTHLGTLIPSNVSFKVDSDFITGFKNQVFGPGNSNRTALRDEEEASSSDERPAAAGYNYLAVVPWVPSQIIPEAANVSTRDSGLASEMMEFEEVEASSMDVEEEEEEKKKGAAAAIGVGGAEYLQQQWQQHCMTPELAPNTTTPITWSW